MMVQHYSRAEQHYLSSMIGVKASQDDCGVSVSKQLQSDFRHANQQAYSFKRKIFLTLL
jgi:hypothetical protein